MLILAVTFASCDVGNGHTQYMAAGIIEGKDASPTAERKGYMLRIDNDTAHYWFYSFPPDAHIDTTKFPQRILINYTRTGGDKSGLVTIKDMQVRYRENFGCPIP